MMLNRRRLVLFAGLALTLGAVALVSHDEGDAAEDVVAPVVNKISNPENRPGKGAADNAADIARDRQQSGLALDKLQRAPMGVGNSNPFGAKSWFVPPPPPPPQVIAPPEPTAPPLPFIYQGKLEESGRWSVYLLKGEQLYVVRKGEVFDGTYRLVGIESGNLVIQYLPLSIKQRLPIGSEY